MFGRAIGPAGERTRALPAISTASLAPEVKMTSCRQPSAAFSVVARFLQQARAARPSACGELGLLQRVAARARTPRAAGAMTGVVAAWSR